MSIDDVDTSRENILRLVRKSASTDYNLESIQELDKYPEYRKRFLECRKQFEYPSTPVYKKPSFFPHWITPETSSDVSITYKRRGNEIIDLRIHYLNNNDGDNNEIGIDKELNKPDPKDEPTRASGIRYSTTDEKCERSNRSYSQKMNKNYCKNQSNADSTDIIAEPYSFVENPMRTIEYKGAVCPMNRDSGITKLISQTQSLAIAKETSLSMSLKDNNRMVDIPRKNKNILPNSYFIPHKPFVCGPVIKKSIELKKYDHILTHLINREK